MYMCFYDGSFNLLASSLIKHRSYLRGICCHAYYNQRVHGPLLTPFYNGTLQLYVIHTVNTTKNDIAGREKHCHSFI